MAELFLIPIINTLEIHDTAVKEWLNKLDYSSLISHLTYPFRLEKYFPETVQRALASSENIHNQYA